MDRARSFCLSIFLFLVALPAFAADAGEPPRSVLEGVPGLERRVTYTETKIPLGELVAKVAADTGVPLRAAADVADEPVAVAVTAFPARELLEQIADLLDYQWRLLPPEHPTPNTEHRTPIYETWQDLASRQREEALRRAISAAAERHFQQQLEICRELSALTQDEMKALWDAWEQRQHQLEKLSPEQQQALLASPEEREKGLRLGMVQELWSPIVRSMAGWMARLSPKQWAALRAGRQVVFSSVPRPGELPLPPDVLRTFRTSQPAELPPGPTLFTPHPEVLEQIHRHEKEMQEQWTSADGYLVTVRFTPDYPKAGWIVFNAIASPLRGGQRVGGMYDGSIFVLNVNPEEAQPPEPDDPARQAAMEQDPLLGVKRPFQPRAKPRLDSSFPEVARSFRTLPDLLPDLARTYAANFIADSYWNAPRVFDTQLTNEPTALFTILDRFCERSYTWDRRNALIRLRSRDWFLDRPTEIPLRYVRRWIEECDRLGALSLEQAAAAASALTDLQLRRIAELLRIGVFSPQLQELAGLYPARHLLRLYAGLLADQQQALRRGARLPIAQIPERLRPLVPATLNEIARMAYPVMDLDQWEAGGLSFVAEPQARVREERGGIVTFRLEPLPARPIAAPLPPRGSPAPPSVLPVSIRRYPVTRLKIQVFYGPPEPASRELIVAPP